MIEKVIKVLETHEWVRGQTYLRNDDHDQIIGCCLYGALRLAAGIDDINFSTASTRSMGNLNKLVNSIETAIMREHPDNSIADFNDNIARNKQDIIDFLREEVTC